MDEAFKVYWEATIDRSSKDKEKKLSQEQNSQKFMDMPYSRLFLLNVKNSA